MPAGRVRSSSVTTRVFPARPGTQPWHSNPFDRDTIRIGSGSRKANVLRRLRPRSVRSVRPQAGKAERCAAPHVIPVDLALACEIVACRHIGLIAV